MSVASWINAHFSLRALLNLLSMLNLRVTLAENAEYAWCISSSGRSSSQLILKVKIEVQVHAASARKSLNHLIRLTQVGGW